MEITFKLQERQLHNESYICNALSSTNKIDITNQIGNDSILCYRKILEA